MNAARHRFLRLLLPWLLPGLCLCLPAAAQTPDFQATLPGDVTFAAPVEHLGTGQYLPLPRLGELLRTLDPAAVIEWDAVSGIYHAKAAGREFSLFLRRNSLLLNAALLDTDEPLCAARGQFFVPLASLRRILIAFDQIQSNIDALAAPATPAPTPVPTPAPTPAPVPDDIPLLPGDPVPAVPSGLNDDGRAVDLAAVREPLKNRPAAADAPAFEDSLLAGARLLASRTVVLLDPQPGGSSLPPDPKAPAGAAVPPDFTLRVALRCRELLVGHARLQVLLTRETPGEIESLEARVKQINTAGAKALLCLRTEQSPFPANGGYRLFSVHAAVDPDGRACYSRLAAPGTLPIEAQYLPYENVSLVLARLLDAEMARAGLVPAPDRLRLAPFFLLKRAAMPSLAVTLGYETNPTDAAKMRDGRQVDAAAASLAQGLLGFDKWLESNAPGYAP